MLDPHVQYRIASYLKWHIAVMGSVTYFEGGQSWQPSGTIRKRKGAPAFGPARHLLLHYNTPSVASNHEAFEDRRAVPKAKPQQAH